MHAVAKRVKVNLIVVLLLLGSCRYMQQPERRETAVAFYNCENFFGLRHDPGKNTEDFTPEGSYHYTRRIYEQKLRNIATVIQSMDNGKGPAIMGLAEVENSAVLDDLVQQPEIVRRGYRYILIPGPDERGINVALLYDPKAFHELSTEAIPIDLSSIDIKSKTRDILHVCGVLEGDTVHVLVNHWPSRRGGETSDPKRMKAAEVCRNVIDKLCHESMAAKVICMGDFNDSPPDSSISITLGAKVSPDSSLPELLYDPYAAIFAGGQGTEEFDHQWNLFDQVILSGNLLRNRPGHMHYEKAEIFRPDFVTDHRRGHEGTPKRSFAGTHWMNGYSDHFPVILYLSKN